MKPLSETSVWRKLSAFCGRICRYHIGHECELTVSLYADETTPTPECSHHFKGSSRHNLFLILGLFGGVILLISLIGAVKKLLCCCKD